jgi:hypothetical protein
MEKHLSNLTWLTRNIADTNAQAAIMKAYKSGHQVWVTASGDPLNDVRPSVLIILLTFITAIFKRCLKP